MGKGTSTITLETNARKLSNQLTPFGVLSLTSYCPSPSPATAWLVIQCPVTTRVPCPLPARAAAPSQVPLIPIMTTRQRLRILMR